MKAKDSVRLTLYLAALALLAWFVARSWPEISAIWKEHAWTFVGVTLLVAVSIALQAATFRLFLPIGERPPALAVVRIWAVASLVNYLGPFQPGMFARMAMLNRLGVGLVRSTVATLRQITASVWIATGLTGAALLCANVPGAKLPGILCLIAFALLPVSIGAIRRMSASLLKDRGPQALRKHLPEAMELPSPVAALGVLALYAGGTAILLYGYAAFGADIDIAAAVLMACGVYVSSLVSLLPGNLGVSEAIYVVGGRSMGLSVSEAAALALLLRTAHIAASTMLAVLLHFRPRDGAN